MKKLLKTSFIGLVAAIAFFLVSSSPTLANDTIQAVLNEVNILRQKGVHCRGNRGGYKKPTEPLRLHGKLNRAAKQWSQVLARTGQAKHGNTTQRIKKTCGMIPWGEVIAFGTRMSAHEAVQGWLKSTTGHCAHMMNPAYKLAGIGRAEGHPKYDVVWTMKLAKSCNK